MRSDFDADWDALAEEVMSGMKAWRLPHSRARRRQIATALAARLGKMRARMLQDAALASAAADLKAAQAAERRLITQHHPVLKLVRSYGVCPTCGAGLFLPREA